MVFFILVSIGFIGYRRLTIGLSQETKNLLQLFEKNFRKTKISYSKTLFAGVAITLFTLYFKF